MSSEYHRTKADILRFLETLRAAQPEAAQYFEKHLIFDDENETCQYTGDHRFQLVPPTE